MTFASILDTGGDLTSLVLGAVAFGVLFLLLEGLDRI